MGVISGGDLPGAKARIKLMAALGAALSPAALRRLFEEDVLQT
jgi:L-asparaginase/Glu-tRNA(Gln) amidotransferase subunit D